MERKPRVTSMNAHALFICNIFNKYVASMVRVDLADLVYGMTSPHP